MATILKIYKRLLDKYPYGSQAVQTALLMGAGDAISQVLVEKKDIRDFNVVRTAKFAGVGLFMVGPGLRLWYSTLDRFIKHQGAKGALLKVGCDQLAFAPTFLVIFISTIGTLNGENIDQISSRLNRDFLNILITNWKVWPLVQMVNFYFVPLQHRVLLAQIVAIFWNTYLAFVTNQTSDGKEK